MEVMEINWQERLEKINRELENIRPRMEQTKLAYRHAKEAVSVAKLSGQRDQIAEAVRVLDLAEKARIAARNDENFLLAEKVETERNL